MGPWKPRSSIPPGNVVTVFRGALQFESLQPAPGRSFSFRVVFQVDHPGMKEFGSKFGIPPLHWHRKQTEFFRVEKGQLTVEVDGVSRVLDGQSGEFECPPGPYHRLYPTPGGSDDVVFYLGATDPSELSVLDDIFFQNWYGYQEDILLNGVDLDVIQVMNMFDAGDTYLAPPSWLPFGKFFSRWCGIIIGRWIGGLLGYQPFHKQWTRDWDLACKKMESSLILKRFAKR